MKVSINNEEENGFKPFIINLICETPLDAEIVLEAFNCYDRMSMSDWDKIVDKLKSMGINHMDYKNTAREEIGFND